MKFYPILIFFVLGTNSFSQTPDYFANNPSWHIEIAQNEAPFQPEIDYVDDFVYYINGDSMIGGFTYHWIHRRGTSTDHPSMTVTNFDYPTDIFVRQVGRSIHYYDQAYATDSVLIDYQLQIGDSIGVQYSGGTSMYDTIISIDSVQIAGEYRWIFEVGSSPAYFVEGIGYWFNGSNYFGEVFRFPSAGPDFNSYYKCYGQNDQPLWDPENGNNPNCYVNVGVEETNQIEVEIFPNPASEQLTIFSAYTESANISVIDLNGKVVLNQAIGNLNNCTLDIGYLISGVYILEISTEVGIQRSKVIIN